MSLLTKFNDLIILPVLTPIYAECTGLPSTGRLHELEWCGQRLSPVAGCNCWCTSNKNFILKYFRCRDGKRTETRIGMEGICITHSCIPLYTVYMQHIMAHSGGMQEWVIQIPSIPILFPSLHLKYFRIKFLLLVCIVFMRMRTKPHPHPVIS